MLEAHAWVAMAAIAVAAAAGLSALASFRRRRDPGSIGRHLLALAQTLLIAQVGLGLLLLSDDRRASDDLHYAYGTFALAAVLAPWLYAPRDPPKRLLWFAGATLLAGALAVRAYTTGG